MEDMKQEDVRKLIGSFYKKNYHSGKVFTLKHFLAQKLLELYSISLCDFAGIDKAYKKLAKDQTLNLIDLTQSPLQSKNVLS